jgi:hypothetical protein
MWPPNAALGGKHHLPAFGCHGLFDRKALNSAPFDF